MKYSPSYKFWKMAVSIFCRRNSWWLLQQVLAYTFFTFIPTKNIFKNFSNICDEVFLWKHLTVSSWMFGTDLNAPLTFCLKLVASAWFEFVLIWPKIILLFPLSFKFYQIFQKCLKNYQKCFLFLLKNSFRSRDSQCFVIFSLLFHCFQVQRIRWNWNNYEVVNWLDCELWIQKPFCTKSSKLPTCYTTKTEIFLNMFGKPKRDWYLVPGPFFQSLVHKKGLDAKENINLTLQRLLDSPLF